MARKFPVDQVLKAAIKALHEAGANTKVAQSVAHIVVGNEAEGNSVCGLFYLPGFLDELRAGRVNGTVEPKVVLDKAAAVTIDAGAGFAPPAIDAAIPILVEKAKSAGIAAASIINSYNTLSLGTMTRPLAERGCVGLAFSNSPAAIALAGAKRKMFGTNPFSCATPMPDGSVLLIDQSSSIVTKTAIMMKAEAGEPIPDTWACDPSGTPTTDPQAGLDGYILPAGGVRGANIALMVEILSAVLTGSPLSVESEPFGNPDRPHPRLGQFMIAIDTDVAGDRGAMAVMERLIALFDSEPALRLPGTRRTDARAETDADGMELTDAQIEMLGLG